MLRLLAILALVAPAPSALAAPVTLDQARAFLVQFEGYRLVPYRDGAHISVGIGHNLTVHGERVKSRYTALEVERMFRRDLVWALDACRAGVRDFDDLPERVQLVALGVCWTVGRTGFHRFTNFRRALSYRAYNSAAHELSRTPWARQVGEHRSRHHIHVLLAQP